jgi:hypothetical protein
MLESKHEGITMAFNPGNSKIVRITPHDAKRNWACRTDDSKGKGNRIVARQQLIFTVGGLIVGDITATHKVRGSGGKLRVYRDNVGNWHQIGA